MSNDTSDGKSFEIVVFGATGFTGKLAAEYISKNFPSGFSWAISGRNKERIEQIYNDLQSKPNPPQKFFVLNHSQREKVFEIVAKAKVALNFAGPFGRYGENVVAACAQLGTHYLDITGEPVWVQKMIEKYENDSKRTGAILIPFSGFDSIPSDLGVWQALQSAKEKSPDVSISKVVSVFTVKGGVNGGTFETFLDGLEGQKSESKLSHDSSLLVVGDLKKKFKFADRKWPVYFKERKQTFPPFFMASINSRVVYRSQALRMSQFSDPQPPFEYTELQKMPTKYARLLSWQTVLGLDLVGRVGQFTLGRKLLRHFGPKAGEGPSEAVRNSGFFQVQVYAFSGKKKVSQSEIYFAGDPGNKATVTMTCESARCLLFDQEKLKKIPGGFWTPSTALGSALRDRLIAAGLRCT